MGDHAKKADFDMEKLMQRLINKWKLILLVGCFLAIGTGIFVKFFVDPIYEATTKMYVLTKQSEATVTNGDMEVGAALLKDYVELIQSRPVIEKVILEQNLDYTYEDILEKISVIIPAQTRVLYVTIRDKDPELAASIANGISDEAGVHIKNIMNIEAVNVVDQARVPTVPVGPNITLYSVIAGIIGAIFIIFIITLKFLLDDTIKDGQDVEEYLGITTLGVIPIEKKKRR